MLPLRQIIAPFFLLTGRLRPLALIDIHRQKLYNFFICNLCLLRHFRSNAVLFFEGANELL